MDPLPPNPFPPGKSPFHIKGIAVQGFLEYVSGHVRGGIDGVAERLTDPAIREFCRQPFLAASWYDILPFLQIYSAAASANGLAPERFIAEHSAWQAARDARGIYRLLLLLATPEAVARRLGAAYGRYFDFTTVEVLSVEPGQALIDVRGQPAILLPWYKVSVTAAAQAILALAGARNLHASFTTPAPDGMRGGMPLVKFRVKRTWSR
jgi:hypothetical protein